VRVIGVEGEQLGVMPVRDALTKAKDAGYDLVEVAAEARPPVCRIMDYGKFRYEKTKRSGKNKAHQTRLKEIRLRPRTGDHDIDFKVKQAIGFLQDKDKVQVTVVYKGRELAHIDEGERVIQSVIEKLTEYGKLESPPNRQAKKVMCTIAPK
jgi:translation initiation factor IF-3